MTPTERPYTVDLNELQLSAVADEYGIRFAGDDYRVPVIDGERLRSFVGLLSEGADVPIYVEEAEGHHEYLVYIRGHVVPVRVTTTRDERLRALSKNAAAGRSTAHRVAAPMPGMLKEITVAEGDVVEKGQTLCILEAMKMENEIKAPGRLVVARVIGKAGNAVEKGAPLLELRPEEGA